MTRKLIMFLLPLLGIISASSCSLENEDEDEMGYYQDLAGNVIDVIGTITLDYPSDIDTYVVQNFEGFTVFQVSLRSVGDYIVELSDTRLLWFNSDGSFNQEFVYIEEDDD